MQSRPNHAISAVNASPQTPRAQIRTRPAPPLPRPRTALLLTHHRQAQRTVTAVALQHRDTILQSIAAGKRLSDLSIDLGVTPQAISKVLVNDPEYQAAIECGHALRLDQAEQAIEAAAEQVDVARAGASWRAVSWRAERECAHRWGAKQEVRHVGQAPAMVVIVAAPQQIVASHDVIDVE